jgi:hypothetical protein
MTTPVHGSMLPCFTMAIAVAEADLPFAERCFCVTGEEMNGFDGEYFTSNKNPDLAVQVRNDSGTLETKLVVK